MASRIEDSKPVFEYSEVPSAYVPSGRMGPHAAGWLIGAALPTVAATGIVLALVDAAIVVLIMWGSGLTPPT